MGRAREESKGIRREPASRAPADEVDVVETSEANRFGVYLLGIGLFCLGFGLTFLATLPWAGFVTTLAGLVVGGLLASAFRIAPQWERVVIMRLGRYARIAGPGPYVVIPFVEYAATHVDQRMRIMSFTAEAALTLDLVPVDIDAAIFWMVWDTEKACLEVEDYPKAVLWSAQTAMRDAIGNLALADLSPRRKQIDAELEKLLAEKCEQWGVSVLSVEIRDITVPQELQDALSTEAQAQSERNARITLSEVEKDISEMLVEAAEVYEKNPLAYRLRALNLAYEGAKAGKGVILAPSDLAEGFRLDRE